MSDMGYNAPGMDLLEEVGHMAGGEVMSYFAEMGIDTQKVHDKLQELGFDSYDPANMAM
jgi:hypothetical protein